MLIEHGLELGLLSSEWGTWVAILRTVSLAYIFAAVPFQNKVPQHWHKSHPHTSLPDLYPMVLLLVEVVVVVVVCAHFYGSVPFKSHGSYMQIVCNRK